MPTYQEKVRGKKVYDMSGLLKLLLDAETYEYSSHAAGAEGFKVAVDHHLDQPLMSISELDIAPGFESQGLIKFRIECVFAHTIIDMTM